MTSTCREPCCVAPRVTVSELVERGLRRRREPMPANAASDCTDAEGNSARFAVALAGDRIVAVGFRATTCATLIAYCEWLAESVPGQRIALVSGLTPPDLIAAVPGVPALKRERAVLAIAALRAALADPAVPPEGP